MSQSFHTMVRKPRAFLPVAMSLIALALLGGAYIYGRATGQGGLVHEPDEGSIAHLWQLLMAGQLPVLAYSPSSGYRERQNRRCACLRFRPEPCSLQWHRSTS